MAKENQLGPDELGTDGMRKRLVLVVSQKGGVGKSALAQALGDFVIRANATRQKEGRAPVSMVMIDGDSDVQQLSSVYGLRDENGDYDADANQEMPYEGVQRVELDKDGKRDELFQALERGADLVLVDTAAGALSQFESFFSGSIQSFVDLAGETGYQVSLVMPIMPEPSSAESAARLLRQWGSSVDVVAALRWPERISTELHAKRGELRGDAPEFSNWCGMYAERNGFPQETLLKMGGKEIFHHQMPAMIMETITTRKVPFYKAMIEFRDLEKAAAQEADPEHKAFLKTLSRAQHRRLLDAVKRQDDEFKKLNWLP